ncbi:MmcQ/YjbR family DNA-binding protein [Hoeflea prorocentri]|uniref:MmcQ/YjbR family DNA-binding protein n=1 Tax=Hoeflea prorocentri TaxID=1922333 RepID=A0A9X3UIG9_9HYPH|nr:MmcQ/YjbR family DNA-binding protein [Hoeflea prorocentri]MCY6381035.1 MmcQ/YjbR family DNA-binding protein [Hoeflea prorocentri]MDA5398835.1 MmcQ/YjbR family DNA-binding protein [Hoeflea prorocentri]
MNRSEFDSFCRSLKATTHIVQWGGASVWKVGGKIFAICSQWTDGPGERFSFKCSDLTYTILTEQEGIVPAPYLARAKWVQVEDLTAMADVDLRGYIEAAHTIVASKLTKKQQRDLGLVV